MTENTRRKNGSCKVSAPCGAQGWQNSTCGASYTFGCVTHGRCSFHGGAPNKDVRKFRLAANKTQVEVNFDESEKMPDIQPSLFPH